MARNFQSSYRMRGQRPFGQGSGSGFGSMSRPQAPSAFPGPGPRMSSTYSGNTAYSSGLNSQKYGQSTSSYSQGYSSSSSYQNQGYDNAGTYSSYSAPSSSGVGGTSAGSYGGDYSGDYSGTGSRGRATAGQYSGRGGNSYSSTSVAGGQYSDAGRNTDSNYQLSGSGMNYTGSGNNMKSTTDTLTLSDFIDDKRGDKSWDPVKRKYVQDSWESEEYESTKKQKFPREPSSGGESVRRDDRTYKESDHVRSDDRTFTGGDHVHERREDRTLTGGDNIRRDDRTFTGGDHIWRDDRNFTGGYHVKRDDRAPAGGETLNRDGKIMMYLGNMPSNVTKEKIETMFEYIPGIVSYSLQRHKYNMSNTCIFVEMTSRIAGDNLRKTFDWMEVNGRCIVCRFCRENEEDDFVPDPVIKSDNFVYKSGEPAVVKALPPTESKRTVYVWNLPCTSTQLNLENYIRDLNYRSIDFVKGDRITGNTGYAYIEFANDADAERMVTVLQGTLYLGSYINARFEQRKNDTRQQDDGDDYLPVPLGEAADFVSQGSQSKSTVVVPTAPPSPKKQPSAQFEEYIKGQEKTPLIGLEFVTEFWRTTKTVPRYKCELCAATPQGSSILSHVVSFKHRLNYMEKKDPDRYQKITSMSQQKSFLTAEALKYATEVERKEGRQLIKMQQNPNNVRPQVSESLKEKKQEPQMSQNADLFSRLTAYKQKIKEIEDRQKEKQFTGSSKGSQDTNSYKNQAAEARAKAKEELRQELASVKEPLLGLEFLKEQPNKSRHSLIPFNCTLCGSQLASSTNTISHVTGLNHRLEYLKRRHHDLYLNCLKLPFRSSQRRLVEDHARRLEKTDGTGTLYVDGEPFTGDEKEAAPAAAPPQTSSAVPSGIQGQAEMEICVEEEADAGSVQARLFDLFKDMGDVPLVGLRYVTETQSYNSYDPPKYKCSLCSVEVSKTFIITHLTGHQHRIAYIKKNYPELERDAESDKDTLNNYCRDIENDIGREAINVVLMRPPKDLNSSVTFSRPISVKVPSKAEGAAPPAEEPVKEVPSPPPVSVSKPEPTPKVEKPKFLMSKLERRAADLQWKVENKDKLTPRQQNELERQLKNDGKKTDGTVFHFYDLIEKHDKEPLLGLASCVEVWHPKDLEPPLFRCDICDYDTNFKHIVEHLMGRQHKMMFFKWMHPGIYQDLMKIKNEVQRHNLLRNKVREFDQTHVRETIQYTVATDDTPWKNWKKDINLMAYMKFDAAKREGKQEKEKYKDKPKFPSKPPVDVVIIDDDEPMDEVVNLGSGKDNVMNLDTDNAAANVQTQKSGTTSVSAEQATSVADMIDLPVLNDDKWEEVNAEIKKRIGEGKILVRNDAAKFLKTYRPFLGKFPVIGLEWLSEFQLGEENVDPWYLCRLCHSKIEWNDIVDHVISMYHRMSFIQKEHPTLHELLKEEIKNPASEKEMNDKIEEFARGIAKPPAEQKLEVLVEQVSKPKPESPKKEFSRMAQKPGAQSKKTLDSGRGAPAPETGPKHQPDRRSLSGDRGPSSSVKSSDTSPQKQPGAIAKFPVLVGTKARQALIGLEYLTEIQREEGPLHYICELCGVTSGPGIILQHLYGSRHRQNFFQAVFPGKPVPHVSELERMATEYERKHGRGRVAVATKGKTDVKKSQSEMQDPQAVERQRREQQTGEKMPQTQTEKLHGSSMKPTMTPTSYIQNQNVPSPMSVPSGPLTMQQGNTFSSLQMHPFPQQNLQQQPLQQPQAIIQTRPLMQQQPQTLLLQQQQQIQQPVHLMQQQLQQPSPLIGQSQLLLSSGLTVPIQQQLQMQQPQTVSQQPQMATQVAPNLQQNVPLGMPGFAAAQQVQMNMPLSGPQQNLQMTGLNTSLASASQQMISQQQSLQTGQGIRNPVPSVFPTGRGFSQTNNNQQHPKTFTGGQALANSHSDQRQKPSGGLNQRMTKLAESSDVYQAKNEKQSDKQTRQNDQKSDLSSYKIPKTDSPRKGMQGSYSNDRGKERTASRKTEDKIKNDTLQNRPSSTSQLNDPSSKNDRETRHGESKNSRNKNKSDSKDSRSASSREEPGRVTEGKGKGDKNIDHKDAAKSSDGIKTSGTFRYTDHRDRSKSNEKSNEYRFTDHGGSHSKQRDEVKRKTNEQDKGKTGDKSSESKKKDDCKNKLPDKKQISDRTIGSDGKQMLENKSKSTESNSGSYIEIGNTENKDGKLKDANVQKSQINFTSSSSESKIKKENQPSVKNKKPAEKRESDVNKSKVSDKKETKEDSTNQSNENERVNKNKSKTSDIKSGSYIEMGESDYSNKYYGKEELADSSSVITIDLVPTDKKFKRKREAIETEVSMKAKQVKLSPSQIKTANQEQAYITEVVKEGKGDKIQHRLSCSVTVNLLDISTLSKHKLEELTQKAGISPVKSSPKTVVLSEPCTAQLDKISKIKVESMDDTTHAKKSAVTDSPGNKGKQIVSKLKFGSDKQNISSPKVIALSKQAESRPMSIEQNEKRNPKSKLIVSKTAEHTSKNKPEFGKTESNEADHLNDWAVTDEWIEEEPMGEDNDTKLHLANKGNSFVETKLQNRSRIMDKSSCQIEEKDIEKDTKKADNKLDDDKLNVVVEVEVGDNKSAPSATKIKGKNFTSPSKEERVKNTTPAVSVTVEIDEDKFPTEKSSLKENSQVKPVVSQQIEKSSTTKEHSKNKAKVSEDVEIGSQIKNKGETEHEDSDDDFIDFSEFVTLDEEGEVDDMIVGSIQLEENKLAKKKDSRSERLRRSRSRSRNRSLSIRSGRDHRPRRVRSRSKDRESRSKHFDDKRHVSRSDRSRSKDSYSSRSGKSGDGGSKRSGSSQRQRTSRMKDSVPKSSRNDRSSNSSQKGGVTDSKSMKSSRTSTKDDTRTTVKVEMSDKPMKSTEKSVKDEGPVASSRALGKEFPYLGVPFGGIKKPAAAAMPNESTVEIGSGDDHSIKVKEEAPTAGLVIEAEVKDSKTESDKAKSNKCSVEIEFVQDGSKDTDRDSDKTRGPEAGIHELSSGGQKEDRKPKCEVSVSIN